MLTCLHMSFLNVKIFSKFFSFCVLPRNPYMLSQLSFLDESHWNCLGLKIFILFLYPCLSDPSYTMKMTHGGNMF